VKIDEELRLGDDLPHGLYVGMFLCNVTANITMFFKAPDERGFAGAAWPDDTDQWSGTWRLHY
jgi:hypothetical protein